MTKILLLCILILSVNLAISAPEFTSKEATSYINKTYEQAKILITNKGYKFSKKHEEFYTFQKIKGGNKYTCTLILKKGLVEGIGTNEYYGDYLLMLNNVENYGYSFNTGFIVNYPSGDKTELYSAPTPLIASTMLRFDKQNKFSCFIICPYNLMSETYLISINYSIYTNN